LWFTGDEADGQAGFTSRLDELVFTGWFHGLVSRLASWAVRRDASAEMGSGW
jgi:hypothetical protein